MSGRAACFLALFALAAVPAAAQVDPSGQWRTLHTTHFRIHFRPEFRGVALQAANEAERAYALLAAEVAAPRGIVDITLSDDVDAANGFASQVPTNRITLLLTSGAGELPLQRFDSWLRVAMVHELAHVFHLDQTRKFWRVLQTVFGRAPGLFPNSYQPSWLVEGIATYYESRFTGAGRVDSDIHRQILAAQHGDGPERTPWSAVFYTRWPGGWAPYAYGGQVIDSAFALAGDSLLPAYMRKTAGQLIPFRLARPYRLVTGRRLADDWKTATSIPAAGGGAASAVTLARGLRFPAVPRLSTDGRLVAYHHDDGRGQPELRIVRVSDWQVVRRHVVTTSVNFDWLGDTLVVAQLDFTARRRIRSDLYSWLPDGRWRRDTRDRRLTMPRAGGGVLATIALTPAGHQPYVAGHALTDTAGTTWGAIVPSRDGQWIAATRHRRGHWALVRWPRHHPDSVTELVASRDVITDPVWDDSGALYFVMPAAGLPQIHQWTTDGPIVLTSVPMGARNALPLGGGSFLYTTLAGDGWVLQRGRAQPPQPGAVTPLVPFDSAPRVATRETGYTSWPSGRPHYWLPSFVDAGAAGRFFGFTTSGEDAVGRTAIYAGATASVDPMRGMGGALLVSEALGNPTLDIGIENNWSLVGVTGGGVVVSEHTVEGGVGATLVTRRWRTAAALRFGVDVERTRYVPLPEQPVASVCTGCVPRDFLSAVVSARVSHFVTAPLTVSAQSGYVVSASYRRRVLQASPDWAGDLQGRLALYATLPATGYAHPVLALRVSGGTTHGPYPLTFGVGGVSSGVLDIGFGLSIGSSRAFPVRGYRSSDASGEHAISGTAELRLPLALLGKSIGHLPFGADQLSLTLFADVGDAWSGTGGPDPGRLIGVGAELVADLRANYDVPLRARFGLGFPVGSLDTGRSRTVTGYAAFGADF